MFDIFEFNSNGFIMTAPRDNAYYGTIDFTIPFYAVEKIEEVHEKSLMVSFKKILSNKVMFRQKIVKLDKLGDVRIDFPSKFEKDMFIENVNKYLEHYN